MKTLFRIAALASAAIAPLAAAPVLSPALAEEFEKRIMTGSPGGSDVQIGRDISRMARQCGLTVNVVESAGSLENFLALRQRPNTQFAIVQNDVLEYFKTFAADDPVIRRAMFGVKIAFPLYNEEVHLLARRSIRSVEELAGKRVSVGDEGSGTFLTSTLVLEFMGVEPSELRTTGPVASLDALIDGEIDAMFYVTGAPAALFEDERIDPQEYHLLPLTDDTLASVYAPSMVPARTYPWLFEDVPVVSVKALLMTYEFDTSVNAYHRASCNAVAEVSNIILNDFTRLQDEGHPKWRDVDLMDIPPGWSIGSCVTRGLDPGFQSTCERETPPVPLVEEPAVNILYRQRICATLGC